MCCSHIQHCHSILMAPSRGAHLTDENTEAEKFPTCLWTQSAFYLFNNYVLSIYSEIGLELDTDLSPSLSQLHSSEEAEMNKSL